MAPPRGNKFWKLRSKHGRDKIFAQPETMLSAAYDYFAWCDRNPLFKNEAIKGGNKAGSIVSVPIDRPFTMAGLCIYLGVNSVYFNQFKSALPKNENDFSKVITHIEEIIFKQKFEGAAIGIFNANIIARDLGLIDKSETKLLLRDTLESMSENDLREMANQIKNKGGTDESGI